MLDNTSQVFQGRHRINAYPNPTDVGALFECSQIPVSPTTTPSCTQQIFVQIPNLPAPIFFDNQTDQPTALSGNVPMGSQSFFPTTQLTMDLYGNSNHSPAPGTHTGTALLIDPSQLCTTQGGKFLMDSLVNPDCVPQTKIEGDQAKTINTESYLITFQSPDQLKRSSLNPWSTFLWFIECVQVNSHFYAFIGTAIACSVIILLLGSCLGYIRRRKILNRQNRLQATPSNGDMHVDNPSVAARFPKNDDFNRKFPGNENSQLNTSQFTRPTSNLVTPTMMVTCRTTKVDSPATRLGSTMHISRTNSGSPITSAVHSHPPPSSTPTAYVVLTSTQSMNQPLHLHPVAEFVMPSSLIEMSSNNPTHESSLSRPRTELNQSTQAVAHVEKTDMQKLQYGHMLDNTSQVFQGRHRINAVSQKMNLHCKPQAV
ncbi:hypothetical protein AHF37_07937 [Paragonimus kellicotti]|nr:hypothetical protein AHF37_07937 [Paragonimus kellicotti]